MDYSAPVALSLRLVSFVASCYRARYSAIGRVEKMEDESEETQRLYRELVDIHLPKLSPELLSDSEDNEINLDDVYDRECQLET